MKNFFNMCNQSITIQRIWLFHRHLNEDKYLPSKNPKCKVMALIVSLVVSIQVKLLEVKEREWWLWKAKSREERGNRIRTALVLEIGLKTEGIEIWATVLKTFYLDFKTSAKPFYRTSKESKVYFIPTTLLVHRPIPSTLDFHSWLL